MKRIMPLTPAFLLATAGAFIGVKEHGGENRGQMVDLFLAWVKLEPGYPWCAAFVSYVGYWSHADHRLNLSAWPLPPTASCWALGQFAKANRILETVPQQGDVFLVFNAALGRFAHTGIIVDILKETPRPTGSTWYKCLTIEGNTNGKGSREGNMVAQRTRMFYPDAGDRFIRWVAMDKPEEGTDSEPPEEKAA